MFLTFADAIFLSAFYAVVVYAFAPFVLQGDASRIHFTYLAAVPVAGRLVMRGLIAHCVSRISLQIESAVREELLYRVLAAGPLSCALKGSLNTLLVDAFDEIMPYFTGFAVALRYAMIIPAVLLTAVAVVSPWSALILFAMAPLIPVFMIMIGKGAERLNQRQWVQITRLAVRFYEACDRLLLLRLFNIEKQEIGLIGNITRRWRVETMQVLRIAFLSALVLEFFATCGIALCAMTLGFAVYEHGFDYGRALFVLLLAPEFFLPLRQLGLNYHTRMRGMGAVSALVPLLQERAVFDLPEEVRSRPGAVRFMREARERDGADPAPCEANAGSDLASERSASDPSDPAERSDRPDRSDGTDPCEAPAVITCLPKPPYAIELRRVTASYPDGRVGLKDFSCSFAPGRITALTGPSGAGKSTLLQTVAGFTNIDSGEILINGAVCDRRTLRRIMHDCAYIPQLPKLFYGTLRDNLSVGLENPDDAKLEEALRAVGAGDLLERFADGLDHKILDHNRGISGGEARLVALARAMVRDCGLLLLDEPTASLDRDSENRFLESLRSMAEGKTVIMVAHRRELMDFADAKVRVGREEH